MAQGVTFIDYLSVIPFGLGWGACTYEVCTASTQYTSMLKYLAHYEKSAVIMNVLVAAISLHELYVRFFFHVLPKNLSCCV